MSAPRRSSRKDVPRHSSNQSVTTSSPRSSSSTQTAPVAPTGTQSEVRRKRKRESESATLAPSPSTPHGTRLRQLETALSSGNLSELNHTKRPRASLVAMGRGSPTTAEQFRDSPADSPEFPSGNRGRHEIAATAERSVLQGKPVAVAVATAARTSTGLSLLRGPDNEVVAHTGLFLSGLSTTGQSNAHKPFHAFPAILAGHTDPHVATALAIETALDGLSTPSALRSSRRMTGALWVGGSGLIEKPDTSRGHDDGYDSDTERGKLVRRFNFGRERLKDSLSALRSESDAVRKATRSPSPPRSRGGSGLRTSTRGLTLPDVSKLSDEETAYALTNFSFAGFQTLKPGGDSGSDSD
jgi:hypothetical protein